MMYAKPSEKTDIYSFAILAWEFLCELVPYANVTSQVELSVQVHQGVRPDINQLPNDCPEAIRTMITTCWDHNRTKRNSALVCSNILRKCYNLSLNTLYDVYFSYSYDTEHQELIARIRDKLTLKGLKIGCLSESEAKNLDIELTDSKYISKSKVIVMCLDNAYQTDPRCISELQTNQTQRVPRLVVPLLLEPQSLTFPSDEFKSLCQFSQHSGAKLFNISKVRGNNNNANIMSLSVSATENMTSSALMTRDLAAITEENGETADDDEEEVLDKGECIKAIETSVATSTTTTSSSSSSLSYTISSSSSSFGMDPLDLEIEKLIDFIQQRVNF